MKEYTHACILYVHPNTRTHACSYILDLNLYVHTPTYMYVCLCACMSEDSWGLGVLRPTTGFSIGVRVVNHELVFLATV